MGVLDGEGAASMIGDISGLPLASSVVPLDSEGETSSEYTEALGISSLGIWERGLLSAVETGKSLLGTVHAIEQLNRDQQTSNSNSG